MWEEERKKQRIQDKEEKESEREREKICATDNGGGKLSFFCIGQIYLQILLLLQLSCIAPLILALISPFLIYYLPGFFLLVRENSSRRKISKKVGFFSRNS